jgi:hypothetical protein
MTERRIGVRRATVVTGVALATILGLSGVCVASAAAPTAKIKSGATWTLEPPVPGLCFKDTFNTITHRFTSFTDNAVDPGYGKGTWSGGGSSISLVWTKGDGKGMRFSGTFTSTPVKSYQGEITFGSENYEGLLVKGSAPGC